MGRWGRFLAASVAVLTLPAGCGGADREGTVPAKAKVELPAESILPADGGASIPSAASAALEECEGKMRAGEYRSLAESMDRRAGQAMPRSVAAPRNGGTTPQTAAICRVCGGVAKINLGLVDEGLADLREAERLSGHLPETVRTPLETLLFSGQVVGYAAEGDAGGVRAALGKLSAVDPRAAERYADKCAAVRPEDATVPCDAPEPQQEPGEPDSSPGVTGGPPSPAGTGPDVVTSPPVEERPSGGPESEGPAPVEPGEGPVDEGPADGGRPDQERD